MLSVPCVGCNISAIDISYDSPGKEMFPPSFCIPSESICHMAGNRNAHFCGTQTRHTLHSESVFLVEPMVSLQRRSGHCCTAKSLYVLDREYHTSLQNSFQRPGPWGDIYIFVRVDLRTDQALQIHRNPGSHQLLHTAFAQGQTAPFLSIFLFARPLAIPKLMQDMRQWPVGNTSCPQDRALHWAWYRGHSVSFEVVLQAWMWSALTYSCCSRHSSFSPKWMCTCRAPSVTTAIFNKTSNYLSLLSKK